MLRSQGGLRFFDILNTLLPPPPLGFKALVWTNKKHQAWMNQHDGQAKKKLSKELKNNITGQIWDMSLAGVCVFVSPPFDGWTSASCGVPSAYLFGWDKNRVLGRGPKQFPELWPKIHPKLQQKTFFSKIPIGFCWILREILGPHLRVSKCCWNVTLASSPQNLL